MTEAQNPVHATGAGWRWLVCAAAHLGLAVAVFRDCLEPGMIPYGRDTVSHDILFFQWGWAAVRALGEIPLWNPMLFAGWPWVAAAGWTPWYPPHWIALGVDPDFAFSAQWALHHAWAGLGFTIWMRALGMRWSIALLGGVLFQMSGHFTTLVFPGHLAKFEAIAWMPWIMAFGLMALRGNRRMVLWAAIALGMQVLTQHAQIVYDTAIALGLMALWRASVTCRMPRERLRQVRVVLAIGLLGGLIAAVQLLPATEMIRISNRAEGVAWEGAVETSYPPKELVELAWPGLFGSSVTNTYQGPWGERLVSDYLGLVTLIGLLLALAFAIKGLLPSQRVNKSTSQRLNSLSSQRTVALLILFVFTLLLALGRYTPLYRLLYDWLPGWDRWRSPATIMFLTTFAAVTMAGLGWNVLAGSMRQRILWLTVAALLIFAVLDLSRVARRHIHPVPAPNITAVSDLLLQGQAPPFSQWPTPDTSLFGTPTGRGFFPGQELSNVWMLRGVPSITGYHPILLQRYQRMFEAMEFNNPNLHLMMGVTWMTTQDGRLATRVPGGEMIWAPAQVLPGEAMGSPVEALRTLAQSSSPPFEAAPIAGAESAAHARPLLGWDWIGQVQSQWNSVSFAADPLTVRIWQTTHPAGVGFANNRLLASVAIPRDEPRWVVVSQFVAPGWRLLYPEDREIRAAWDTLWAVHMPGPGIIEAVYEPASVRVGWFLTLCSLAGVVIALLAWRRPRHG